MRLDGKAGGEGAVSGRRRRNSANLAAIAGSGGPDAPTGWESESAASPGMQTLEQTRNLTVAARVALAPSRATGTVTGTSRSTLPA